MYLYRDNYQKPLKGFLNKYMAINRNLKLHSRKQLKEIFFRTVNYIDESLGKNAFRPKRALNASVYDSVMVGVAEMLARDALVPEKTRFISAYNRLLTNPDYILATNDATSDEPVVEKRMRLAIDAFIDL